MKFRIKMQNKLHIIGIFLLVLFARIGVQGGFVKIGENCSVNPFCVLYGHGGLEIGDGVTIHRRCVVGGGAVVTKDISEYSVAVGVPAKVIKRRIEGKI